MSQSDQPTVPAHSTQPPGQADSVIGDLAIRLPPPAQVKPLEPTHGALDRLLVFLVLLLAFFLGSAPVRNSDLWLHLASGRQLLQGKAEIGVEPFTFPQENAYWVNSSWLFDIAAYLAFDLLGGAALAVLKAGSMVVLAALLLGVARGSGSSSVSVAALSTSLALIVLGPWMALRPSCLSLVFLAWTIWYLERYLERHGRPLYSAWPLLLGFAVWANLDRWFIIGPMTVLLYGLGSLFANRGTRAADAVAHEATSHPETPASVTVAARPMASEALAWLVLWAGSLAACLFNPHHYHVFSVIGELVDSQIAGQFQVDPFLRGHFSPFQDYYWSVTGVGTATAWAFWLLGLGSFVSFFLVPAWPWRWGLLWAFFAVLSLVRTQAIPFFAIVGGMVLARNIGAWAREHSSAGLEQLQRTLGRFALLLFLIALVVAAWPGWLQLGPHGPRSWKVAIDPSMQGIADDITARLRQQGLPEQSRVFNVSPDSANYLAWLCPEMQCFVNSHMHLTAQDAATFLSVREGMSGLILPGSAEFDWRASLRQGKVSLLLIHGGDPRSTTAAMSNLFRAYRECPLIVLRGRAVLFGWRDPIKPDVADPYAGLTLDLKRMAFREALAAPATNDDPIVDVKPAMWWESFWKAKPVAGVDREEVATLLTYFDSFLDDTAEVNLQLGRAKETAEIVAACGIPGSNCLAAAARAGTSLPAMQAFMRQLDDGPVAPLYLGLRRARRAIALDPTDAQTYFLLGETYHRLTRFTRERNWAPIVGNLRTCQTLAAFRQAVEREPRHWAAHERLAEIYRSMDYRDLTFLHLRESYLQRTPARGESREHFQDRLQNIKNGLQRLEKEVNSLRDRWEVNSTNLRVSDRADMAGSLGLPGKALEVLLGSDIAAFGAAGLEMELKLLLNSGEPAKVKQWLSPDHLQLLAPPTYYLIRGQSEAALGNYVDAVEAFGNMVVRPTLEKKTISSAQQLALVIGNTLLYEAGSGIERILPMPTRFDFPGVSFLNAQIYVVIGRMQQQACARVLQGLLAVEAGAVQDARDAFRDSAAFWDSKAGISLEDPRSEAARQITRYFVPLLDGTPQ